MAMSLPEETVIHLIDMRFVVSLSLLQQLVRDIVYQSLFSKQHQTFCTEHMAKRLKYPSFKYKFDFILSWFAWLCLALSWIVVEDFLFFRFG